jgi:hypothetical protein
MPAMVWLAVLALVVAVGVALVALRALNGAHRRLGFSLDRLGDLRVASDALAVTVADVAAQGRLAGDAVAVPARP